MEGMLGGIGFVRANIDLLGGHPGHPTGAVFNYIDSMYATRASVRTDPLVCSTPA